MEYVQFGKSDFKVSRVCLGCMGFGKATEGMHTWTLSEEDSQEIIRYALDKGINFFDTAMGYSNGTSEEFLGRAIKKYAKREDVIIATKFLPRTKEEREQGISAKQHIENCLNASLKRLQMDYVDLYILHMWDYHTPIIDILEGLHHVIQQGKVRYIGISNCYAYQIAMANEIAKAKGYQQFISVQGHYNLIFREEEREMKKYCDENQIAMTPYSALASGRLAKKPEEQSKRMQEDQYAKKKYDATQQQDSQIIERVMTLAKKKNLSMSEISLAWLMQKVTSPIIGATKYHHIDSAIQAVDVHLTNEEMMYLEELYLPHKLVGVMAENN